MNSIVLRAICAIPALAFFTSPTSSMAQSGDPYGDCIQTCWQADQTASGWQPGQFMARCAAVCEDKHLNGGGGGGSNPGGNNTYEWWWQNCAAGQCKNDPDKV